MERKRGDKQIRPSPRFLPTFYSKKCLKLQKKCTFLAKKSTTNFRHAFLPISTQSKQNVIFSPFRGTFSEKSAQNTGNVNKVNQLFGKSGQNLGNVNHVNHVHRFWDFQRRNPQAKDPKTINMINILLVSSTSWGTAPK